MADEKVGKSLAARVRRWPRWSGQLLLCGWWLLIFAATHVPLPSEVGESPVPDKLIHFVIFAVLGVLLPLWNDWTSPLKWSRGLLLFGIVTAYALIDELLQIPVGRSAEWLDGAADLTGGACGLTMAGLLRTRLFNSQAPFPLDNG